MKKALLIIIILIIVGVYMSASWFKTTTDKIFIPHIKLSSTSINTVQNHIDTQTPINILLLGYGGGNHDGAYLTDSMMVIHIDPKQKKTFLVSIPRDIWIKIPTNGTDGSYWKINAAYELGLDTTSYPNKQTQFTGADGGGRLAEYVVSQVTGMQIDYFVGMDFSGFKHTIDTLGGVDITVEKTFDDYSYPIDGKEAELCGHQPAEIPTLDAQATQSAVETIYPCRYEHLHFDAGLQHMDGATALAYVRSRHSLQDGTDFGRAKRQRNLITAVKQKIFSAGFIPQIIPFMGSLGDDLRMDLSQDDVKSLLQNATEIQKYQITTLAITDQNYLIDTFASDGEAILQPKDGLDNWNSVHTYISDSFSGKTEQVGLIVKVENGTHTPGIAQSASDKLQNQNIQIVPPDTAPNQSEAQTKIILYDKNGKQADVAILKKEFGVQNVTIDTSIQPTGYNTLVILGTDYIQKNTTPTP